MAYTPLRTDYANDVLASTNSNVKYVMTDNGDGTVSFTDATSYTSLGDQLNASVLNNIGTVVNSIESGLTSVESTISNMLNMFYPVGSYYETSDSDFDPNVSWGGTWSLETAGKVHIGAGTGYTIGATGGEATHVLKPSETAIRSHQHDMTHTHSHSHATAGWRANYAASGSARSTPVGYNNSDRSGTFYSDTDATASSRSLTVAPTEANGAAHNNMQPYIVVNRWHRTA